MLGWMVRFCLGCQVGDGVYIKKSLDMCAEEAEGAFSRKSSALSGYFS